MPVSQKILKNSLLAVLAAFSRIFLNCSFLYVVSLTIFLSYIFDNLRAGQKIRQDLFFYNLVQSLFVLYWVYVPLTFDYMTMWLIPFAVLLLPIYVASYHFVIGYVLERFSPVGQGVAPCLYTALVCLSEWICGGIILGGFPWMNAGYCWATNLTFLQIVSIIGIDGLSFFTVLSCAFLGEGLSIYRKCQKLPTARCIFFAILYISIFVYGAKRLSSCQTEYTDVKLKIVHGNIDQRVKNDIYSRQYIYDLYEKISTCEAKSDLIIWPEACFPWVYSDTSSSSIVNFIHEISLNCKYFLTGCIRKDSDGNYYNSLITFPEKEKICLYDKNHLLPFGEYMPFRKYIPVKSLATLISDFAVGNDRNVLKLEGIPGFQVCICYESIFSKEFSRKLDSEWILNITNDGWFGNSNENFQHDNMSKIIAIEHGLPMVRSNNYGISAVYDPYGRKIAEIRDKAGAINIKLPKCLKPTFFSEFKNRW